MTKIKIFISSNLYFGTTLGVLVGCCRQNGGELTIYLLRCESCNNIYESRNDQILGEICNFDNIEHNHKQSDEHFVQFIRGSNNILLNKIFINGNSDTFVKSVQIILYDDVKWLQVAAPNNFNAVINAEDHVKCLTNLIQNEFRKNEPLKKCRNKLNFGHRIAALSVFNPLLSLVNKLTVVKHMADWYHCLQNGSTNTKQKLWTTGFDVLAGLVILFWLIYLGKPGHYFMQFTEFVVYNVRILLNSLKGSPGGLKLNVELNNFFLNCFTYHVDLWATFLVLVSPIVQYLFIPLAIIGCLGLSFQLALLSDLLVLISVHAHCFYIYAAVLYHIEIVGISALWRVLLGKRNNILKNRTESHDYTNPQLYLATMFFATLLFILPTVLVYYVVFATLRFCVYSITYCLAIIQRQILLFPSYNYVKWLTGSYLIHDNIEMSIRQRKLLKTENCPCSVSVVSIDVLETSVPARQYPINVKLNCDSLMSIDQFLIRLIRSDMLGFIHPRKK